jgi:hypothetical protein
VTAIAERVQTDGESAEVRFSQLESDIAAFKKALTEQVDATSQQFNTTKITLDNNFDYHLKYNKLDLWARFQDFQIRIRNAIIKRQALDYITIGFNGVSRAATSDRAQNPLLQDVAVGWLQKYRNDVPERVMSSVTDDDRAHPRQGRRG